MKQIDNTQPIQNKEGKRLIREFTGKTENFEDKKERNFYQKMLSYYCKGASQFPTGRDEQNNITYTPVAQEYYYATN